MQHEGSFSWGTWDLSCLTQTLCRSMRDLVPWSGTETRPPGSGAQSLSHWPIREVPTLALPRERGNRGALAASSPPPFFLTWAPPRGLETRRPSLTTGHQGWGGSQPAPESGGERRERRAVLGSEPGWGPLPRGLERKRNPYLLTSHC